MRRDDLVKLLGTLICPLANAIKQIVINSNHRFIASMKIIDCLGEMVFAFDFNAFDDTDIAVQVERAHDIISDSHLSKITLVVN